MKKKIIILISACVLICLAVTGCYSCSPEAVAKRELENNATRAKALAKWEKKVSTLNVGSAIQDVQKAFGSKGKHEFTVQKNNTEYMCLSFPVGKNYSWTGAYNKYYSIFENDVLYAIVKSPSFEYDTKINEKGHRISHRKAVVPEKRVETVFAAKNLIGIDLFKSFQDNFPRRTSCSNLGPMVPLLTVLGPVSVVVNSPGKLFHDIEINSLKDKYDPLKISIGMLPNEVDSVLGKPNHTCHPDVDKTIHVYGSEYSVSGYPQHRFTWISVEFKNSHVISIYSNDFFDDKLIPEN